MHNRLFYIQKPWNTFGEEITEQLIFQMADVMEEEGYKEAGYEYVVIDDCWAMKERDSKGNLVPDPEKFPNGMKAVADYVHKSRLQIHLSFSAYTCFCQRK